MFPPGVALPGASGPSAGSFVPIAFQSGQSPPLATYHVGYTPEAQQAAQQSPGPPVVQIGPGELPPDPSLTQSQIAAYTA